MNQDFCDANPKIQQFTCHEPRFWRELEVHEFDQISLTSWIQGVGIPKVNWKSNRIKSSQQQYELTSRCTSRTQ
eukprot:3804449-Rhodomonas_salina.5